MRELKFRAFDKLSKKMVFPNGGDFIGWHAMSNWKDCLTVMQYTGLKDRNGKEIYEGDIVNYKCTSGKLSWDTTTDVRWEGMVYRFWNFYLGVNMPGVYPENDRQKYLTVVGNIYENPDLLEQ
jgi:uncharacterized phage protein (TIGR01671 family)